MQSTRLLLSLLCGTVILTLFASATRGPPSSTVPFGGSSQLRSPPPKPADVHPTSKSFVKQELPPMARPFGMPGVIGLNNGKWEGTDYLGFVGNHIGISVEVLKPEGVPPVPDAGTLEGQIASLFTKENIEPRADVSSGPPLPFFHLLLLVYPVDQDKFVVFGNGRLFEQVQVVRKDFLPAGVWQGITWENHDVILTNAQQLDAKVRELADKLTEAFIQRHRQYNINREGMPASPPS